MRLEKYEMVAKLGEGAYGVVYKCRRKDSGEMVAIKKFVENEEDPVIRKIALREVRMLRQLKHPYLVNLLEVFKRKGHMHLVFEYVDHTLLNELERNPTGLETFQIKRITWQILKALNYCHNANCIHRDIKPENILITAEGNVKLCDFGFARLMSNPNGVYTDYIATRWYRAPELLVGDAHYNSTVDIWALGVVVAEMMRGRPLWTGKSDLDQLHLIVLSLGPLPRKHAEMFYRNGCAQATSFNVFAKVQSDAQVSLEVLLANCRCPVSPKDIAFLKCFLAMDAALRWSADRLLSHNYFETCLFPDIPHQSHANSLESRHRPQPQQPATTTIQWNSPKWAPVADTTLVGRAPVFRNKRPHVPCALPSLSRKTYLVGASKQLCPSTPDLLVRPYIGKPTTNATNCTFNSNPNASHHTQPSVLFPKLV